MPTKRKPYPRTPYENIVIGNFLYGLGLSLGVRAGVSAPLANISNTQQTPLDSLLADVWMEFPGVCRLLEFKRQHVCMDKELLKRSALADVLDGHPTLTSLSRRIHLFAEIRPHQGHGIDLAICPYLDFTSQQSPSSSMAEYVAQLTEEALRPSEHEPAAAQVSAYLRILGNLSGASDAFSGALMVQVLPDGSLRYFPLADLRDLNLQYSQQIARDHQWSVTMEQQRDKDHEFSLERQSPDRGMER